MKKFALVVLLVFASNLAAQDDDRVITTAVPFLNIAGDARAAGMGDMGVATSFDAYSQQWNPSKYAFADRKSGVFAGYTPYLESVIKDIGLLSAGYFNKIDDQSAFAVTLRYFTLGTIVLRQSIEDPGTEVKPNEFSFDGSYSLKLSPTFSMGVGGRYIRSQLRFPQEGNVARAASGFAIDVSGFYQSRERAYTSFDGRWRAGFNLANLGPKIRYDEGGQENFLPTNLKFGLGFDFILDQDNRIGLTSEFNKLLVPTPQDFDNDGDIDGADNDEYQSIGFFNGIFTSFGDSPDGFGEELKEFTWALGAEYVYQDSFMIRTGYFNESAEKGARKFFTLGAGFKFNTAQIDLSYLFSTSKVQNPLEGSLRFSLAFNIGEEMFND